MSIIYSNELVFSIIIGTIIFIISYIWSDKAVSWLRKRSLGNREYVLNMLEKMFVETNKKQVTTTMLLLSFGLGTIVFVLVWPNVLLGGILGSVVVFIGWQIPRWLVDMLYKKRLEKFSSQLVDAMTIMANGISSGLSTPQSMERVAKNMPNPISQEFQLALSQVQLGLSLEEALIQMSERLPIDDIQMFVTSVNILKETGGNLAETFSTIVETIRERQKVQKKIEALTAQGVMQGVIITMVPFIMLAVFAVVDPGYVKPLFTTTFGIILLLLMVVLQVLGGLAIRKVVTIKV